MTWILTCSDFQEWKTLRINFVCLFISPPWTHSNSKVSWAVIVTGNWKEIEVGSKRDRGKKRRWKMLKRKVEIVGERGAELFPKQNEIALLQELVSIFYYRRSDLKQYKGHGHSDPADHTGYVYVCRKNPSGGLRSLNGPFSCTGSGLLWFPHDSDTNGGPTQQWLLSKRVTHYLLYGPSHCSHLKDVIFVVKKNSTTCLSRELGKQSCTTGSNLSQGSYQRRGNHPYDQTPST